MRLAMFKNKQDERTILILYFDKTTVAIAEPIVYPKYTTLPRVPNYEFSILSSYFIFVDPAGNIPISTFINKYAKNCM
jgi:hypothetical protein